MKMIIDLPPELAKRVKNWSSESNEPPENLALGLIEEYFEDCDDAEKLENLIRAGEMKTYSMEEVHRELREANVLGS